MTSSEQQTHQREPAAASGQETLLFDLYGTLVDPLAIATVLGRHLSNESATQVAATWRQKQLEYSFRLTMMQRYENFAWITARSLEFALLANGLELPADERAALLEHYDAPEPFSDVEPALRRLTEAGHSLYVLSNGSPEMLQRCLVNSGLAEHFKAWLSVDAVEAFKPSPQVYEHAGNILGRPVGHLWLISCNPFDVIGGKSAGMRAAWLNRSGGPFDTIGDQPDMVVSSLDELAVRLTPR
ncbi:MAG: haloacid dehalogenase type II [Pseudonocardia sp.]